MGESVRLEPDKIRSLLAAGDVDDKTWSRDELRTLLNELLANTVPANAELSGGAKSIGDVLAENSPSLGSLIDIKNLCKQLRVAPETGIPEQVSTLVYYSAIALGMTRCGERITVLDDAQLLTGFQWCLSSEWVSDDMRQVFSDAGAILE